MKWVALALALLTLGLSATPCCVEEVCTRENQVTTDSTHDSEEEHESPCSPFFTCGSCLGFSVSLYSHTETPKPQESHRESDHVNRFIPADVHCLVFKPPRKVLFKQYLFQKS